MDDDQELYEGKHTQTKGSLSREETRDDEHQHLVPVYMYQLPCVDIVLQKKIIFNYFCQSVNGS